MVDLSEIYKKNFEKNLSKIKDIIVKLEEKTPDNSLIQESYNLINENEKIIRQMQLESSSLNDTNKYNEYSKKIKEYQNKLYEYKKIIRKEEENIKDKINNSLFENSKNMNLKNGLIENEVLAHSSKQKIEEVQRELYNIEDGGKQALNSLEKQTASMKAVKVKIQGMNDDLESSNNLLNVMKDRIQRNKRQIIIFGIGIIFLLILIIIFKLLFK